MQRIKRLHLAILVVYVCAAGVASGQAKIEIIPDVVYGHKDGMNRTNSVAYHAESSVVTGRLVISVNKSHE